MKETKQQLLTLLAFSKADAYGIVQERGFLFHIKPPFSSLDNKEPISEQDLEYVLNELGYEKSELTFNDYDELSHYLEQNAIEERKEAGREVGLVDQTDFRAYLKKMPPVVFKDAVNELEEIYEQGDYEGLIFQAKAMLDTIYQEELQEELNKVQSWLESAEKAIVDKYLNIFPNLNKEGNARVATLTPLGVQSRA